MPTLPNKRIVVLAHVCFTQSLPNRKSTLNAIFHEIVKLNLQISHYVNSSSTNERIDKIILPSLNVNFYQGNFTYPVLLNVFG